LDEFAAGPRWTIFTNHGHVLISVAMDPDARIRDIAESVGITERSTQAILRDLEGAGYIERTRLGRRNSYHVLHRTLLHHPVERGTTVGDVLAAIARLRED
jgi:DNA-binding MarR family transcriptional regulator